MENFKVDISNTSEYMAPDFKVWEIKICAAVLQGSDTVGGDDGDDC